MTTINTIEISSNITDSIKKVLEVLPSEILENVTKVKIVYPEYLIIFECYNNTFECLISLNGETKIKFTTAKDDGLKKWVNDAFKDTKLKSYFKIIYDNVKIWNTYIADGTISETLDIDPDPYNLFD